VTFEQSADAYIKEHSKRWRNDKHRGQWPATLAANAYPLIGSLPVAEIDTGLVLKILRPIWDATPETASRVRGRIESVLDWATAHGHRTGDNPARWRGHLENLLVTKPKAKHYGALGFDELPGFISALRQHEGVSARALEFTILTAARTSETLGAKWSEIRGDVWTIPDQRMKAGKEHEVPLSKRARTILQSLPREGEYVFIGGRAHRPLSTHGMLGLLRRMRSGITVHGFRSTFRDWAGDRTNYPREVIEHALAHRIKR
jgi:integrase